MMMLTIYNALELVLHFHAPHPSKKLNRFADYTRTK
jgi:hypothetical protein